MQSIEHVEGEVALESRNAHRLHMHTNTLESFGRCHDGRRHLGIDRPETRLDEPAHSELSIGAAAHASIETHGARREGVFAVGTG